MKTSKLVTCKNCGKEIAQESGSCPECGGWNFSKVNVVSLVVAIVLILFFITGGFGGLFVP